MSPTLFEHRLEKRADEILNGMLEKKGISKKAIPKTKKNIRQEQGDVVAVGSNLTNDLMDGSMEQTRDLLRTALIDAVTYGKNPYIIATFPEYVFIEATPEYPSNDPVRFFKVLYTIEGDTVKLGTATEIEKETTFIVKEMMEDVYGKIYKSHPVEEKRFWYQKLKEVYEVMGLALNEAVWTTKLINDLPDSCFAFIRSGGEKDEEGKTKPRSLRFLPYKDENEKIDLPHLKNAMARLPQTDLTDDEKKKAKEKLDAAAKEMKIGDYAERLEHEQENVLAEQMKIDKSSGESLFKTKLRILAGIEERPNPKIEVNEDELTENQKRMRRLALG